MAGGLQTSVKKPERAGFERATVPPERILAHCAGHLARFKVPRYIAYRDSFPMTVSARVEKKRIVAEADMVTALMEEVRQAEAEIAALT